MNSSCSEPARKKRKLYYKIGEVSREVGVPVSVIRFWETRFSQIKPRRTASGQRLFRRQDIELLKTIHHLIHEKRYTIEGCMKALRDRDIILSASDFRFIREELIEIHRLLSTSINT
ncbi:MAG: MerR family transcriptional regulator [Thermodesulfobacteriota bacterium]